MLHLNPQARRGPYDDALKAILDIERGRECRRWLAHGDLLAPGPTPLWRLPMLARRLGLAEVVVKDESRRSTLGSFKALGAPVALLRLILRDRPGAAGWRPEDLLAGRHAAALADYTVVSATDGNHGRALAAAAQRVGCGCVIVLHAQVSAEREDPIAALGARIVRIAGDYDASVREAARLARANGWQVVSDTSYDGYEAVPRDVMQGYAVIADEALDLAPADGPCPFTHVVLQGGVGGLAAGVISHFWERYGARRPVFIVVEPEQADCLLQSALAGRPARAIGSVDSVMAGLACGEASPLAWRFLEPTVDLFMTVSDEDAVQAMRLLAGGGAEAEAEAEAGAMAAAAGAAAGAGAGPAVEVNADAAADADAETDAVQSPGDVPILAGESGAAGLAALLHLATDPAGASQARLDASSRVLLINTEGATAPGVYAELAGRSAASVLAAQARWRERHGIDATALAERIARHAEIGSTGDGGVCRIALTDADRLGRDRLVGWMREQGLAVRIDRIGNIFGIRAGLTDAAPVMTGSHIDTVATGGRYDGMYGVLAGLEVLRRLDALGLRTRRPLVVAAFTNEEGVRFAPDMLGSLVHAGGLPLEQALDIVGTDGRRLGDELARIGYAGDMACGAIRPHAFVELHIEQGPVLEADGLPIGAVQDLQGISWQRITIDGQSNHAGTTPMRLRRDAGHAAAAIAVAVRALTQRIPGQLGTVGAINLHPNLINVIASRATLTVDLRHTDEATLQRAEAELAAELDALAAREGVAIRSERLARFEPVRFDERLVRRIEAAAGARGLAVRRMTSGAGHDAQMIARIAPAAMIFVPSRGGISHNPREHTEPSELVQGANVLFDVLWALADEAG